MSLTPPPAPPAASAPIPSRRLDDQETFDTKTDAYMGWLAGFRNWLATFAVWLATFVAELNSALAQIPAAVNEANSAAQAALAASNFKGAWSSLAGALARPASVLHDGQYWMLLNDLLDVAASQPGVDTANWAPMIDLKDAAVPATGGVMDCSKGDTFTLTVNGNVALSFVNVPPRAYDPVLEILHISGTITIPAGAVWANGKVPEFLTGRRHLLFFHRAHTGSGGWIMSALEGSAS